MTELYREEQLRERQPSPRAGEVQGVGGGVRYLSQELPPITGRGFWEKLAASVSFDVLTDPFVLGLFPLAAVPRLGLIILTKHRSSAIPSSLEELT